MMVVVTIVGFVPERSNPSLPFAMPTFSNLSCPRVFLYSLRLQHRRILRLSQFIDVRRMSRILASIIARNQRGYDKVILVLTRVRLPNLRRATLLRRKASARILTTIELH
jgi:hypothetical protein